MVLHVKRNVNLSIDLQDGFVLVGSVAGQRYWSTILSQESTITAGSWTPDDQQVRNKFLLTGIFATRVTFGRLVMCGLKPSAGVWWMAIDWHTLAGGIQVKWTGSRKWTVVIFEIVRSALLRPSIPLQFIDFNSRLPDASNCTSKLCVIRLRCCR